MRTDNKYPFFGASAILLAVLIAGLYCGAVLAQTTNATIAGSVKDETGAVLPGVTVSVKNLGTGVTRSIVTDDQGRYVAAELPSGDYDVQAELTGFQITVRSGIALTVGRHALVDVVLKVGAVNEKVTVTGEAPLVETTTSSLSGLVGEQQIRDLPLNGRNFVQLALIETGVVQVRGAGQASVSGLGLKMSFHGARMDANNFMMDGTSVNSVNQQAIGGSSGVAMGVETIREFQVLTSNFTAEFGRAGGGTINAVTKSGTNELHGSVFYFHRNDNLDAANFFDNSAGRKRPEFKRNQFGMTAGGPIHKDKTFFFGGYEGLREGLGQTLFANVPTAPARQGILPTGGNVTVNPRVKPFLDLYPLPNGRDFNDGTAEFTRGDANVAHQDFYNARVDHNISDSDSVFVRYTIDDSDKVVPRANPTWEETDTVRSQYVTIEEKKIVSARLLNVFRVGFNRTRVGFVEVPLDSRVVNPAYFFIPNPSVEGMGTLSVSGIDNPGATTNLPQNRGDNVFQFTDTVNYNVGAHSLKVGGEVQRIQTNERDTFRGTGNFNFNNLRTFLLGTPASFTGVTADSDWIRGYRQTLAALFLQDDFKFSSRLTLNLGVRWEFITSPTEVNGKASHLADPLVDSTTVVGNPLVIFPKDNIAPRIGFAWDPFGDGKTSIRGGFGMFHSMVFRNTYFSVRLNPPHIQNLSTQGAVSFPNPLEGVTVPVRQIQPSPYDHNKLPYMFQYNLGIQRELFPSTVLTVSYVGSRGRHLGLTKDINTAIPQIQSDGRKFYSAGLLRRNTAWTEIRWKAWEGDSYYSALQLKVARRASKGLQFQGSYTWAHSLDNSSSQVGGDLDGSAGSQLVAQDPFNLRAERGNSVFDLRHVAVISAVYDVPLGQNLTGPAAALLRGWQISGILNLTTGAPFTAENVASLDRDRDQSTTESSRPNLVAGRSNNPVLGGPDRYFDPSAFVLQDIGYFGNLGRNTLFGPGLATVDFQLVKNARISGERMGLQFQAGFFNVLNRANFGFPDRTVFRAAAGVVSGSVGRITSTSTSARQVQLALKITF